MGESKRGPGDLKVLEAWVEEQSGGLEGLHGVWH